MTYYLYLSNNIKNHFFLKFWKWEHSQLLFVKITQWKDCWEPKDGLFEHTYSVSWQENEYLTCDDINIKVIMLFVVILVLTGSQVHSWTNFPKLGT